MSLTQLWSSVNWAKLFRPETPILEIVARGTVVYLALVLLLRAVLKRQAGTLGITDLLVIVLLADAAQNALAGGYDTVTDGLLLVGVIVFWAFALDWLAKRFPRLRRLLRPPALPLVRDGQMLRRNMARELMTEEELMGAIRLEGLDSLDQVRAAYMEGDGRISIIPHDGARTHPRRERRGE